MTTETRALVLDLVEWAAVRPRTLEEVMAAWRTSCPRLTIWEDALDQGLVVREHREGMGTVVTVMPAGWALLENEGRWPVGATPGRCNPASMVNT